MMTVSAVVVDLSLLILSSGFACGPDWVVLVCVVVCCVRVHACVLTHSHPAPFYVRVAGSGAERPSSQIFEAVEVGIPT